MLRSQLLYPLSYGRTISILVDGNLPANAVGLLRAARPVLTIVIEPPRVRGW